MMVAERIAQLKNDWIDERTLMAMYGLRLTDNALQRDFIRWARLQRRPRSVVRGDGVSRFALENFFQHQKMLPIKWAAAKLGMTQDSFENAIDAIETSGRADSVRTGNGSLVPEEIDRVFIQTLPPLQTRVFANHDNFCKRLHEALSQELGTHLRNPIEPLYCVTAQRLHPADPDFSYGFCVLTDKPVGVRYRVWLDFGKPLNIAPDTCSFVAYFDNIAPLRPYSAEEAPERPASL